MPPVIDSLALTAVAGGFAAPPAVGTSALAFATHWLLVCIFCALAYWAIGRLFFRCGRGSRTRFVLAVLCVAVAGAMISAESHTFAFQHPLLSLPIQVVFLLFFYIFPDRRFTPTWTRWLAIFYVFSQLGTLSPGKQSSQQVSAILPPVPGLLGALVVLGDMLAVTVIVMGILPQVYGRYRNLVAHSETSREPKRSGMLIGVCGIGCLLLLIVSALFAAATEPDSSMVYLLARTAFYLLATLVPVAAAFALLHIPQFDRPALGRRATVSSLFILSLLLIFAVCVALLGLVVPGFAGFSTLGYLPFVILIALLLGALFRPLRAQIQDRVDQYVYPAHYRARRYIAAFRSSVRDGSGLDELGHQLITTIQKAFAVEALVLWLPTVSGHAQTPDISLRRLPASGGRMDASITSVEIGAGDPLRPWLSAASRFLTVGRLPVDSAATRTLAGADVVYLLTFVSQGVLTGALGLGARAPARPYTADDAELLMTLADELAPMLQTAAVAHHSELEARQRERVEQELQTARRIQESLLPKEVPALDGWHIATRYQPAREVGGDFYDFLPLADGKLGVVLGDVTDKGIPAALVMATTRSMLRAVAMQPQVTPSQALAQVNDLLCPDLPSSMFVTCFYAILDPANGNVTYANAGQDPPYLRHPDGSVSDLYATGMPMGLLPGSRYEEGEATVAPGDELLFFSDGLVEAHNAAREMFDLSRLQRLLGSQDGATPPITMLLRELAEFTGPDWEQEDDITLVSVQRMYQPDGARRSEEPAAQPDASELSGGSYGTAWRALDAWSVASEPENEQQVIARVAQVVGALGISAARLEQLKTAVGEATMNAMEHGNHFAPEKRISIEVVASQAQVAVRITDEGGPGAITAPVTPDLDAKLAGLQSPRGWGLFLIEHLVDEMRVSDDATHRTVELVMAIDDPTGSVLRS